MARPLIDDEDRRTHWIKIRVSARELAKIIANAAMAGLAKSEFLRRLGLEGVIIQRDSIGDKRLLMSLSPIGNNLNQCTRSLNEIALTAEAIGDQRTATECRETLADVKLVLAQVGTVMEALIE